MSRWKPIDTYRPGVDPGTVLLTDESDVYVSAYSNGAFDSGWGIGYDATHWQPLPPLPGDSQGSQSEGDVLEWEKATNGTWWAGDYRIEPVISGRFSLYWQAKYVEPFYSLEAAQQAAQSHADLLVSWREA